MRLLVDANALLWWLAQDGSLGSEAVEAIASPENDVFVSAATVWEIEVKRVAGRVRAPEDLIEALDQSGITPIPFTPNDAVDAARLPRHHADPFDRMLVAQAIRLDAIVVSRDERLDVYAIDRLPA